MKYEVYVVTFNDVPVYVGYGLLGRHKHTVSGVSHNYDLNKLHFTEDNLKINVRVLKYFEDKEGAKLHESRLIEQLKPIFNVSETSTIRKSDQSKSWLDKVSDTFLNNKDVDIWEIYDNITYIKTKQCMD